MSILFSPIKIGNVEIQNRFVRSATYEAMAEKNGRVTDRLIKLYSHLAKGGMGLIITSFCYIHPNGRAADLQLGIHSDEMIPGLKKMVEAVHQEGVKIAFQIVHCGLQTDKKLISGKAIAPSKIRNQTTFIKPKPMDEKEIEETKQNFIDAAQRAYNVGADIVQIHAAHGYLINQFLSPFFNKRTDTWGGSVENNFRFFKEIVLGVKEIMPNDRAVIVKLNTNDYIDPDGITPPLARDYAKRLIDLGIDGIEISCGASHFSMFNCWRGDVPYKQVAKALPKWMKPLGKLIMKKWVGKYNFTNEYNLDAAKLIKPVMEDVPLMLVGGVRKIQNMEEILKNEQADLISMSRPFIREPHLVEKIRNGKIKEVACKSCNLCFAAIANNLPLACYVNGLPKIK